MDPESVARTTIGDVLFEHRALHGQPLKRT